MEQKKIFHHKNELSVRRPFSCEYCNNNIVNQLTKMLFTITAQYASTVQYNAQITACGAFPQQQYVAKECPLTMAE